MPSTTQTIDSLDIEAEPENACSDFSNIGRKLYNTAGCVTNIQYSWSGYSENIGLSWDSKYQLTAISTNGVECERNGFDALGRRVWTWDPSTGSGQAATNYFVYSGNQIIADVDSTGGLRRAYTHGPGLDNWLAMTVYTGTTVKTYFYLTDHLGTVHALADETGAIVESYRFDAWGRVLGVYNGSGTPLTESAIGNRILWQGREYSWNSGLYYFRARWYDPITGRWLSNDPIGISGGLNQYVFVGNNPVNFTDAFGLCRDGDEGAKTSWWNSTGFKLGLGHGLIGEAEFWLKLARGGPASAISPFSTDPMAKMIGKSADYLRDKTEQLTIQNGGAGARGRDYWIGIGIVSVVSMITTRGESAESALEREGLAALRANQGALIKLAKTAYRNGITRKEAGILLEWAAEYKVVPALDHIVKSHGRDPHIRIGSVNHIPVR